MKTLFKIFILSLLLSACKKSNTGGGDGSPLPDSSYITFVSKANTFSTNKIDNFFGAAAVNNSPAAGVAQQAGIGWVRTSVQWDIVQPTKTGGYNWATTDALITANKAQGISTLIMMRNTPYWAAATSPYDFITTGKAGLGQPTPQHWFVTPTINAGTVTGFTLVKKDLSNITFETTTGTTPDLRVKDINDWVAFVHAVVTRYSAAPYNVKYYQLCNEHRPESTQYPLDVVDSVASRWFVPAAKDIHASFAGVKVMNCWPTNATEAQIAAFDAVPGVLTNLDIYAQHYGDISRWKNVFNRYATSKPNIAFWATEYGATDVVSNPWKITHSYPNIIAQCLAQQWDWADKFKIFWYPYNGNAQPYQGLFFNNATLTTHGQQVKTLYSLLYGNTLNIYNNYTASPNPDAAGNDYSNCFETDRGYVLAIGLLGWVPAGKQITVTMPAIAKTAVNKLRVVDVFGKIIERPTVQANGSGISFTINTALLADATMEAVFVEILK